MTIDEANAIIANKSAKLPTGDDSAHAHFMKAMSYDTMRAKADTEVKANMAEKACTKHLNVAAALETLGKL